MFRGQSKEIDLRTRQALCKAFGISEEALHRMSLGKPPDLLASADSGERAKWIKLAEWLALQTPMIQNAFLIMAETHGFEH